MDLGHGFPEWTELGQDSGLDPLGMQRPIEAIYQSLIPGISTITLRYRYYSFFSLILKHYEEKVRHPDPAIFQLFHRRCEALLALVCAHGTPELGITGTNWAAGVLGGLNGSYGASIDFIAGASPGQEAGKGYLLNKAGAFGAIYSTQMAEMGLIHFPGSNQPNPNPICSELALRLADALSQALGNVSDQFFAAADHGSVTLASLQAFETMKPGALIPGSGEHVLLKDILLGKSETPSAADFRRQHTLRMLLEAAVFFDSVPSAEVVKWHWFENAPAITQGEEPTVPHLWFLYQASDLLRMAYETILSACLTVLESAPRQRATLSVLIDEITGFANLAENQSWGEFASLQAGDAPITAAKATAAAMLEAVELEDRVASAVRLIAQVTRLVQGHSAIIDQALRANEHFLSLRTERGFLASQSDDPSTVVFARLIQDKIIKRHLWVASRKFRNQRAYTFHMEPEDGVLRYRSQFGVAPSSPRIDQALRFMRDVYLLDEKGVTDLGRAELAAA